MKRLKLTGGIGMKKLLGMFLLLGVFVTSNAFGQFCPGNRCNGRPSGELTFEEFKEACENPDFTGAQRPPQQIRIECSANHVTWEAQESAPVDLPQTLNYTAELFSDKYHVQKIEFEGDMEEETAMCPVYQEVEGNISLQTALTCDDVLEDEDVTLESLCEDEIDSMIDENPDSIEYEATGETINLCEESFGRRRRYL